jgi:hypothetical protein
MSYNIDRLYSIKVDIDNNTLDMIVSTTSGLSWVDTEKDGNALTFNVSIN